MIEKIQKLRDENKTIVLTNGCFDILHPGHIQYLSEAKALGNVLVVGLNDDDSVFRLKGHGRPINSLDFRMKMLAALRVVDIVIPFSEDTPIDLINRIKPDFLVKGGDYAVHEVVGAKEVLQNGGEVRILSFASGYSSTALIEKIKNLRDDDYS